MLKTRRCRPDGVTLDVSVEAEVSQSLSRSTDTLLGLNGETQRVGIPENFVNRD